MAFVTLLAFGPAWAAEPDAQGPTTTISTSGTTGANGWWTSSTSIALSCLPAPCTPSFRIDGGAWTGYSAPFVVSEPGIHLVEVRAEDDTGTGPTSLTTIVIDPAPPQSQVAVAGPLGDAGWLLGSAELTIECHDDTSGCQSTTYSLDGQPSGSATEPIPILGDGAHPVRYRSSDHAGWQEDLRDLTIHIDGTPPTADVSTTCTLPGMNGWCRGDMTANIDAADATSGLADVTCQVDARSSPCDSLGVTGNGVHIVTATARDVAGHTSTSRHEAGVDTDLPAVTLSVDGPSADDGTHVGTVTVHATCHDATSGCATLHLETEPDDDWSGTLTLESDGTHTIGVYAKDHAGNIGLTDTTTITIDTTGPTPSHTLSGPRGNADWFVGPPTVALHCTDSGSGCANIEYRLNEGPSTTYRAPFVVADDDAAHAVAYVAVDHAGNTATPEQADLSLDGTSPEIGLWQTCDDPGTGGWCRGTITSHASGSDETSGLRKLSCTAAGLSVPCAEHTISSDGMNVLQVHAEDHAGNVAEAQAPLRRDGTGPTISFAASCPRVGLDGWCAGPVTVTPLATDPHSGVDATECRQQGVLAPCDDLVATAAGVTTFTASAHDLAGNRAAKTTSARVDTEPPGIVVDITCASGWQQDWCASTVKIRALAYDDTSGVNEIHCRLDGAVASCPDHEVSADGRHDLVLQARDHAGNSISVVRSFGVDQTPPEVEWTRPEAGCVYIQDEPTTCADAQTTAVGPLTMIAVANDDTSGIASITVQVDGRERFWTRTSPAIWTWDEPDPLPANHRVAVLVQDHAGHLVERGTHVARVV